MLNKYLVGSYYKVLPKNAERHPHTHQKNGLHLSNKRRNQYKSERKNLLTLVCFMKLFVLIQESTSLVASAGSCFSKPNNS